MDSLTYRLLFGQITDSCLTYHHYFPGHNLISPETLIELSKDLNNDLTDDEDKFLGSFPCYQQFPYGVRMSFPLFCGSGGVDYARELLERKLNWERKLKKLRISDVNKAIACIKKLRQNKRVALSVGLSQYIKHIQSDPEPVFSGPYNWLYTGGCLGYDVSLGDTTLISANYIDRRAGFNLLMLNKTLDGVKHKSFTSLKIHSPVLQIKSKGQQEKIIICVRQKNYLNLFSASRDSNFSETVKLWSKKVLKSKLLTCVDLTDSCEQVVLTDTNRDIHVFHVEKKIKINSHSVRKLGSRTNLWNQIASQDQILHWASTNCFAIFDLRDLNSGAKFKYDPTEIGEKCEGISSFVSSKCNSNFVYLATTHSALQMDLRNGQTVQKWTHMMKSSPQFMTSIRDDEGELLVLQSQLPGETVGIVNECVADGGRVKFLSRSLPYLLTSVKDFLNSARLRGVCLNPLLKKRVNFAVTGMECLRNGDGEIVLLTKNSGGDVFLSKIKKTSEEGDSQSEIPEGMKRYESNFEDFPPKNTTVRRREVIDMSHLLKRFSQRGAKKKRKKPGTLWKYEEMFSPENLKFYRDILAKKILNVWSDGRETSEDEKDEVMPVEQKVLEWMEKC